MAERKELKVLFVDDNPQHCEPLLTLINDEGKQFKIDETETKYALDDKEAFKMLESEVFDIIFLDIIFENRDDTPYTTYPLGRKILEEIRVSNFASYPVVVLTNYATAGHQVPFLESGCDGFLAKDIDLGGEEKIGLIESGGKERIGSIEYVIQKALRMGELRKAYLKPEGMIYEPPPEIVSKGVRKIELLGVSAPMKKLFNQIIHVVAEPRDPDEYPNVLLLGDTGTGKSTVARLLHYLGPRPGGPFLEIVLNTIPRDLLEAELFGVEKYVATLVEKRIGIIEACDGGTLFLDEIGDLPFDKQVKLLRAIREKKIMRVGGREDINVDFKLISATNQNLEDMVKTGGFRPDLYHRIRGVQIYLPTLRERLQDNPEELEKILRREQLGKSFTFFFTDGAKKRLLSHTWPGNYAEIKSLIDNLSLESTTLIDEKMLEPRLVSYDSDLAQKSTEIKNLLDIENHKEAEATFKIKHVKYWIQKTGNQKKAAQTMGIDASTIHRILGKEEDKEGVEEKAK